MYVYLLHFDEPIGDTGNPRGQAQHYIGCCEDLPARLETHRKGHVQHHPGDGDGSGIALQDLQLEGL